MINSIVLVGRVTVGMTLRYAPDGQPVAQFFLAVGRDLIPVVTKGRAAEDAVRYLRTGCLAGVRGRLQIRECYDPDLEGPRWSAEVVAETISSLGGNGAEAAEPEAGALPLGVAPAI
jgi:single-stranded DNA-binding protein